MPAPLTEEEQYEINHDLIEEKIKIHDQEKKQHERHRRRSLKERVRIQKNKHGHDEEIDMAPQPVTDFLGSIFCCAAKEEFETED